MADATDAIDAGSPEITAQDVAAWIVADQPVMGSWRLMSLVFYCRCWSLSFGEGPLFAGEFSAEVFGPVHDELRKAIQHRHEILEVPGGDPARVAHPDTLETLRLVLDHYGIMDNETLNRILHRDTPYRNAREQIEEFSEGLDREVRRRLAVIPDRDLAEFYAHYHDPTELDRELDWGPPMGEYLKMLAAKGPERKAIRVQRWQSLLDTADVADAYQAWVQSRKNGIDSWERDCFLDTYAHRRRILGRHITDAETLLLGVAPDADPDLWVPVAAESGLGFHVGGTRKNLASLKESLFRIDAMWQKMQSEARRNLHG